MFILDRFRVILRQNKGGSKMFKKGSEYDLCKFSTEVAEYEKTALRFLKKSGISCIAKFKSYGPHFPSDERTGCLRNIWTVSFSHPDRSSPLVLDFGSSLKDSETDAIPTAYSILACLPTYYPGTLSEWC